MHKTGQPWSKIRGACKAVRRALSWKRDDDTYSFPTDTQWTLVKDFRFVGHDRSTTNSSLVEGADDLSPDKSSRHGNHSRKMCRKLGCHSVEDTELKSGFHPNPGQSIVGNNTKSQKDSSQEKHAVVPGSETDRNDLYSTKDLEDEQKPNLKTGFNVFDGALEADDSLKRSSQDLSDVPQVPAKSAAQKVENQDKSDSEDDCSSSISNESYADSSSDEDSYFDTDSEFPDSGSDVGSHSSSAKESSATDSSESDCSDEEYGGCLKKPTLDTIVEHDVENDSSNDEKDEENVKTSETRRTNSSNEVPATIKNIQSIRQMWKNIDKEAEIPPVRNSFTYGCHRPPLLLPQNIHSPLKPHESRRNTIDEFEEKQASDTAEGVLSSSTHADKCVNSVRDSLNFNEVCRRWDKIGQNLQSVSENPSPRNTKAGRVHQMALNMQLLDDKVKEEEEMVANHRPLLDERNASVQCPKPGTRGPKTSDDSFLKYLLEIGEQDEINKGKSSKNKKINIFPNPSKTKQCREEKNKTKSNTSQNLLDSQETVKKETHQLVDSSVTDIYFREILNSKHISDGVKARLKEEFWYIFNNSKTPRGVKKSILDKLIVDFA